MSAGGVALVGLALLGGALAAAGCGDDPARRAGGEAAREAARDTASGNPSSAREPMAASDIPSPLRECHQCHRNVVETFLRHGMADSLGPLPDSPRGKLANPRSGNRYRLEPDASSGTLTAVFADGGRRRQRLVGRIGAGRLDTSFVGTELGPLDHVTGRLFFVPLEWITGHGLALAPFELSATPAGLDQPITPRCLECHTDDAAALDRVYPRNLLGADALQRLRPLDCAACHGDTARHADLMLDRAKPGDDDDIGLARLAALPAAEQRDRCARCHLEGEANLELAPRSGAPNEISLLARRPALVPARASDDFRFVGQLERLALSACFRGSPAMTCTSCHLPHTAVYEQGTAAFDAACQRCHVEDCSRPPSLAVSEVTGTAARSADGCVDCHVRRSQPFDIPLLVSADHFVRRRIPPPATAPARATADPTGPLVVFDDGRLSAALATEAGRRWSSGLVALGLSKQGRMAEAAALLADFPTPGGAEACHPTSPPELPPLETCADFHHVRGLVLEATGDLPGAEAAYGDALQCDPSHPEARLNRASVRLRLDDPLRATDDVARLADDYPQADKPLNLRALIAARAGELDAAVQALSGSVVLWPSDAAVWHEFGRLLLARGDSHAYDALERAAELAPGRPGLQQDLEAARKR